MELYIDNQHIETDFEIEILDYTEFLNIPEQREDEQEWRDKSGVDPNLENARMDSKDISVRCLIHKCNESDAYDAARTFVNYIYEKKVGVCSLRDAVDDTRQTFLCERSDAVDATIHIREYDALYIFDLGLKDINPQAIKYKTEIISGEVTIAYDKGRNANIYWGDGRRGVVGNSGNYTQTGYADDGDVDVIIDLDYTEDAVATLTADFSADITSGVNAQTVVFTDLTAGTPNLWGWVIQRSDTTVFATSSDQNPTIIFNEAGIFTVTLQAFNSVGGSSVETKTDYITIRSANLLINGSDIILVNATDKLLKN